MKKWNALTMIALSLVLAAGSSVRGQNQKADAQKDLDKEKLDLDVREHILSDYRDLIAAAHYQLADDRHGSKTYLGVGVEAPGDALRAQLRLQDGLGLVVNFVDPNGPSKDAILPHDVLEKLDDQLLINGEQFATLVRMHKQGESITVSLIREAKPMRISVKLGQKEVSANSSTPPLGEKLDTTTVTTDANFNTATVLSANSLTLSQPGPVTFDDGSVVAVFQPPSEQNLLIAVDRLSGKLIFNGPVTNDQQWNELPESVRNKLSSWRGMTGTINASGDVTLSRIPYINRLYRNSSPPATQPTPTK